MKKIIVLGMLAMLGSINTAWAEAGTHMHVAIFFIDPGVSASSLPSEVKGENIEQPLKGKAELMTFVHSANIKDGDVQNIQNDTLRFDSSNKMQDYGVNCSLTMNTMPIWNVKGMCKLFLDGKGTQVTKVIKQKEITESLIWYQLFVDEEHRAVAYAMKESGENL